MDIDKTRIYRIGDYSFHNFTILDDEMVEKVREWRNHPDIRKYMYTKKEISQQEHQIFLNVLAKSNSKAYWLVYHKENPMGIVSIFDIDWNEERAELGYYMAPSNMNSGLSVEFLTFAHKFLFETIGLNAVYGGTNINNTNALLLNKYFGGIFGHTYEREGEKFIAHEIPKVRFEERKNGMSNWRNFVKFCRKYPLYE